MIHAACPVATLGDTIVNGYRVEAIASADNRGFTLPVLPNEGEMTASGAPIGNDVTCHLELRQAIAYAIDRQLPVQLIYQHPEKAINPRWRLKRVLVPGL